MTDFKHDAFDPPREVDIGNLSFDNIPITSDSEELFDGELDNKTALEKFTKSVVPVIPTPRFDPLPPPKYKSSETTLKLLVKLVALEVVLSCVPILFGLYGGDYYIDKAATFWDHPTWSQWRHMFCFAMVLCAIINGACIVARRVDDTPLWSKFAILAAAITGAILHTAGETRLEVIIPAGMVIVLVFLQPIYSQTAASLFIPAGCVLAITMYAIVYRGVVEYAQWRQTEQSDVYLDITTILFCMCVPAAAMCLPSIILVASFNRQNLKDTHVLVFEVVLMVVMCIASSIPTNIS